MPTNVGGTGAERELALRQYKAAKLIFDNHVTVEETTKNMIVAAVHEAYLGELQDKYTEYLRVSTRDMLDHLDISQPISIYF
eukprot:2685590-Ditylum_brightwellii.AAC.1